MTIPVWVYFVVAGIVISAFMAIKTGREDHKFEQEIIEREGKVYIDRLQKEKEQRKEEVDSVGY